MPKDAFNFPTISDRVHRAINAGDEERLPPELVNELHADLAAFYEHQRRKREAQGIEPIRDPLSPTGALL